MCIRPRVQLLCRSMPD